MPRAQIPAEPRVDGQWQKTGGRRDATLLKNDGAVVQRRARPKNRDEQIVGQRSVERNAALDVVPQPDLALERDDRSRSLLRQHRRRHDDLFDRLVGGFLTVEIPEERRPAEMRERAANVGLKDDNRGKRDVNQRIADQPIERLQRHVLRRIQQKQHEEDANRHLHRTSAADELERVFLAIDFISGADAQAPQRGHWRTPALDSVLEQEAEHEPRDDPHGDGGYSSSPGPRPWLMSRRGRGCDSRGGPPERQAEGGPGFGDALAANLPGAVVDAPVGLLVVEEDELTCHVTSMPRGCVI